MPTVNFNTHLPGYVVLAELGRGNTRVLKARHEATGEVVAIKQYAFATDADTLRRFERESQIMTQIDHPNIVRVREVQLDAAMPYVVMDFVEGGDLRSLLRQGLPDLLTLTRLGLQLTDALRTIHARSVVHRDIKPENVLYRRLVSGELHFLLTDFGIAKLRADESTRTRTGQSLMTYEYAAPEQFDKPRQVGEAADYYALGVVLYECLTGQVPFVLENETGLAQFMQRVLTAPLPPLRSAAGGGLPPSLVQLVTELLRREPQQRLTDPDRVELLLEQSRVEYRQGRPADWTAPPSERARTLTGPKPRPATSANVVPELRREEPAPAPSLWGWGLGGVAVAAALAFGVYTYSQRSSGNDVSTATPTEVTNTSGDTSTTDVPFDTSMDEESTEPDVANEMPQPETPPADSTGVRNATTADSVATSPPGVVAPPDSTQL